MNESIHRYFQIGTLQWMSFPNDDFVRSLTKIANDDYFDVIETCGFGDESAAAKSIIEQSGLKVFFGAQPTLLKNNLNPNALPEEERLAAENALIRCIDQASSVGAKSLVFMAGKWHTDSKEAAYLQLLKTTRSLCDYASPKNITVELEVFDYDVDKAVLVGPAGLALRFAEDIRKTNDNFGLVVDLSHIPITHETSKYVIHTLKPYITHFHFGNAVTVPGNDAYGDKHPRLGYPNSANDTAELAEFLRVIKEEGFLNDTHPYTLSMEVTPRPNENADFILANTKRKLNRAWAMI